MKTLIGIGAAIWMAFVAHGIASIWRGYSALMAMSR